MTWLFDLQEQAHNGSPTFSLRRPAGVAPAGAELSLDAFFAVLFVFIIAEHAAIMKEKGYPPESAEDTVFEAARAGRVEALKRASPDALSSADALGERWALPMAMRNPPDFAGLFSVEGVSRAVAAGRGAFGGACAAYL